MDKDGGRNRYRILQRRRRSCSAEEATASEKNEEEKEGLSLNAILPPILGKLPIFKIYTFKYLKYSPKVKLVMMYYTEIVQKTTLNGRLAS